MTQIADAFDASSDEHPSFTADMPCPDDIANGSFAALLAEFKRHMRILQDTHLAAEAYRDHYARAALLNARLESMVRQAAAATRQIIEADIMQASEPGKTRDSAEPDHHDASGSRANDTAASAAHSPADVI